MLTTKSPSQRAAEMELQISGSLTEEQIAHFRAMLTDHLKAKLLNESESANDNSGIHEDHSPSST
jgi:hypothetical protein